MSAPRPAPELWNPLVAFDALPKAQQRRVAAAAMIIGCAQASPETMFAGGAELAALDALGEVAPVLPPRFVCDLAPLGVRFCRGCGCTDDVACAGGCHWVAPRLCSRCESVEIPHA